ncbi:RDD family protein, partial [Mycobacterium sp.]|uniref:RDD family protein n=1 Tax=Mycobacterium sp. TaxID=1785 RepID=UPI003BB12E62
VWNYGYRQGTTGSSIGKSLLKFKVVSENTGKPIGFGLSALRQITHVVDAVILHIGYLFPLWTAKRQTLADKIMATVCLPVDDR